jgi:hypothetical protein
VWNTRSKIGWTTNTRPMATTARIGMVARNTIEILTLMRKVKIHAMMIITGARTPSRTTI